MTESSTLASTASKPTRDSLTAAFREKFDAVVMLTWSNWKTEPRSNRYHFASRFARLAPVVFVQEDSPDSQAHFEETEIPNVSLLHVPMTKSAGGCDQNAIRQVGLALRGRGIVSPLVWVYNPRMKKLVRTIHAPLKVFHATEDFVSGDFFKMPPSFHEDVKQTLDHCDLMVAVSEGVESAYRDAGFTGPILVSTNGCDFEYLSAVAKPEPKAEIPPPVACYQGGINKRLDFDLIRDVARRLPDWKFRFLGEASFLTTELALERKWNELLQEPNVVYLGRKEAGRVRAEMHAATVGLIPFIDNRTIVDRSFPLKAFEYVACGLPVVSVPVRELKGWPELFDFAAASEEFAAAIERSRERRNDARLLATREKEAAAQSYEVKFWNVVRNVLDAAPRPKPGPRRVLVLYDDKSVHVKTIEHHLMSFYNHSKAEVNFAACTGGRECRFDLANFDAVVVHYCVRVCVEGHLSASYAEALRAYPGLKILFAQDEYDHTNLLKDAVRDLGLQVFYTCVPQQSIRTVYSEKFFDRVRFIPTMTGYVPPECELRSFPVVPLSERKLLIGYRGRDIGWWYGDLAREKLMIGVRMKEECDARGLKTDIAWTHKDRIYGAAWLPFLASARATLATESGSNVFDFDGRLKEQIEAELAQNPEATYEEVHAKHLADHEGKVVMNQISPKLFEAIVLRTALVLFEGKYSGVVEPDLHFIPLKKDFSNVDDVLAKLHDEKLLQEMTERAYRDVVASGRFSYRAFVQGFDADLDQEQGIAGPAPERSPVEALDLAALAKYEPDYEAPKTVLAKIRFAIVITTKQGFRFGIMAAKWVLRPARNKARSLYSSGSRWVKRRRAA